MRFIKWINMHIIVIPGEERNEGTESLFSEMMAEDFPKLGNEIDLQIQEAKNNMNLKRPTQRHINIKLSKVKDKERILKAARKNNLLQGKLPLDNWQIFQAETLQARRMLKDKLKALKEKKKKKKKKKKKTANLENFS